MEGHRGIMYPARLPRFRRLPVPDDLADLVRWFWVPQWDIAPGRTSRQHVVGFPALNLVVQSGTGGAPATVELAGPTTRASHRDLTGRGWAVGALLQPAATPGLHADPADLRDGSEFLDLPDLRDPVVRAMEADDPDTAVAEFGGWLRRHLALIDDEARLANAMTELLQSDPTVLRLDDAAGRLAVSARTLQRLAARYVGVPPTAMIRRRRLQEALQRIRSEPGIDLAGLAVDLGYVDQAHLGNEVRTVLGIPPGAYRTATAVGATASSEGTRPPGRDLRARRSPGAAATPR